MGLIGVIFIKSKRSRLCENFELSAQNRAKFLFLKISGNSQ